MNGIPNERTQIDGLQEMYSDATGISYTNDIDRARQEFKDETDVNTILRRFGVTSHGIAPQFGETDYTLDLSQALNAADEAMSAWRKMPPELLAKYPTWLDLLNAARNGTLGDDLKSITEPATVQSTQPTEETP